MNLVDRCIEFCTSLDPDFSRALRGSTPDQIAELTRVMGRPPSAVHLAFLERMGEDTGALKLGLYATSPREMIERRPDLLEDIPEGVEPFAVPVGDDEEDIFLLGGDDPEVVRHDGAPLDDEGRLDLSRAEPVAGSLSELICLPVLNARLATRLPLQAMYTERELRPDTLARCRWLAGLFGFEPYWFSNAHTFAAKRGSLILVAKQAPEFYLSVGLAGSDEADWGVVSRTLQRELELDPYR
ncbi:hypothetical protein ACSRUE_25140 [Sorangium sp. KYC3313]|uniref:hypothetical protein n=1 Tax=Sorangium sp. KYC3313 TaxID=3449740 RepID=UPI003F8C6610